MVVIVNQIVKGSIVAFAGYLAMHKFYPPEMFQHNRSYPVQRPVRDLP